MVRVITSSDRLMESFMSKPLKRSEVSSTLPKYQKILNINNTFDHIFMLICAI